MLGMKINPVFMLIVRRYNAESEKGVLKKHLL